MKKEKKDLYKPRWEVLFSGEWFPDRLHLFEHLCKYNLNSFPLSMFPHSRTYYLRAHLEDHFQREFSQAEIMNILKDKTWQWHTTSSQPLDINNKEEPVSVSR